MNECERCGASIPSAVGDGKTCHRCLMNVVRRTAVDEAWVRDRFPQLKEPVSLSRVDGILRFKSSHFGTGAKVILYLVEMAGAEFERVRILANIEKRSNLDHSGIAVLCDHGEIDGYAYAIETQPDGEPLRAAIHAAHVSRNDMLTLVPKITEVIRYAEGQRVTLSSDSDTVYLSASAEVTLTGIGLEENADPDSVVSWIEKHPAVGNSVGNYQLIELLGEGGFAEVYRARQDRPVRRDVALKILKLGMDTRQVLARFARERQALAQMGHSGIAKIHDAGATDAGRPYIIMELVEGLPITDYCDSECLTLEERARLLAQVCRAVEHGHERGIIHRDLKPSNVMVAEEDGLLKSP